VNTDLIFNIAQASITKVGSTPETAPVQHDVLPHDHGWLV
jgi:hypothetical protein